MKKRNQRTFLDSQIMSKRDELQLVRNVLSTRVKNILAKEKAVLLYPDGPDKKKAINDLETEKQLLLCSVASYDTLRMEFRELLKKDSERNTTINIDIPCSSHEYIECIIRGLIF